jgi:hypothetical protein
MELKLSAAVELERLDNKLPGIQLMEPKSSSNTDGNLR